MLGHAASQIQGCVSDAWSGGGASEASLANPADGVVEGDHLGLGAMRRAARTGRRILRSSQCLRARGFRGTRRSPPAWYGPSVFGELSVSQRPPTGLCSRFQRGPRLFGERTRRAAPVAYGRGDALRVRSMSAKQDPTNFF